MPVETSRSGGREVSPAVKDALSALTPDERSAADPGVSVVERLPPVGFRPFVSARELHEPVDGLVLALAAQAGAK